MTEKETTPLEKAGRAHTGNRTLTGPGNGKRQEFWDIIKAIGIISIVFGHSQYLGIAIRAVYFYHLSIFFFAAGYLYNEGRYGDRPLDLLGARVKSLWVPYVCYSVALTALHNLFARLSMFPAPPYGRKEFLSAAAECFFLTCRENASAPFWFVPLMLITTMIFGASVWFCRNYLSNQLRYPALAAICCLMGVIGVVLTRKDIDLYYQSQTALLVIPVFYGGFWLRRKQISIERYLKWYAAAACGAFFAYCLAVRGDFVELSLNLIPGGLMFYVISGAGIYLCCFAAKWLLRVRPAARALAVIGRYSFDIMMLHIVVFKLVDGVYGRMMGAAPETLMMFPHSFYEMRYVYLILGTLLPAAVGIGGRKALHCMGGAFKRAAGKG